MKKRRERGEEFQLQKHEGEAERLVYLWGYVVSTFLEMINMINTSWLSDKLIWQNGGLRGRKWSRAKNKSF